MDDYRALILLNSKNKSRIVEKHKGVLRGFKILDNVVSKKGIRVRVGHIADDWRVAKAYENADRGDRKPIFQSVDKNGTVLIREVLGKVYNGSIFLENPEILKYHVENMPDKEVTAYSCLDSFIKYMMGYSCYVDNRCRSRFCDFGMGDICRVDFKLNDVIANNIEIARPHREVLKGTVINGDMSMLKSDLEALKDEGFSIFGIGNVENLLNSLCMIMEHGDLLHFGEVSYVIELVKPCNGRGGTKTKRFYISSVAIALPVYEYHRAVESKKFFSFSWTYV